MGLNRPCQYALLAMSHLAEQREGELIPVREISKQAQVPLPFLSKILGTLSRHGLVTSRRGPNGGVMLNRPAGDVSLGEVVEALDGPAEQGQCYLGLPECSEKAPCPVHNTWAKLQADLRASMCNRTLEDLSRTRTKRRKTKKKRPTRSSPSSSAS